LIALIVAGILFPSTGWAKSTINGQVGADVGGYSFSNFIYDESTGYDVQRSLSNQFVDMASGGALFNGYFANYGLNFRVNGTQIRSDTDGEATSEFINPRLSNYYGSVALFPSRRFPLGFHFGRNENYSIRYEANNKREIDTVDPGLTVLRRYRTVTEGKGADFAYAASPALGFFAKYQDTSSKVARQYDFDENKNIWVDFSVLNLAPGPVYEVSVVNTIPDRAVLLYIDEAFVDTVQADETIQILVEEGVRRVEFIPMGLNSFRSTQEISANMVWRIYFSDPPGGSDSNNSEKNIEGSALYDAGGAFSNSTRVNLKISQDKVQKRDSNEDNFDNEARYLIGRKSSLRMKTSLIKNGQSVAGISSQENQVFQNNTELAHETGYGIRSRLAHRYTKLNSDQDGAVAISNKNALSGSVTYPTHWNDHEATLRLDVDSQSDNIESGYKNAGWTLGNILRFRKMGFLWTPNQEFISRRGWTEKSNSNQNDIESRLGLKTERRGWGQVGNFSLEGFHSWRRRTTDVRETTKVTVRGNLVWSRSFGPRYNLSLRGGLKVEEFNAVVLNSDDEGEVSTVPNTQSQMLGLNLSLKPWDSFSLLASINQSQSEQSDSAGISGSLNWFLPIIHAPLRAQISKSERLQEGRPPQNDLRAKVSLTKNIRKIKISLAYNYLDSDGSVEHFTYNEFTAIISRSFDVQ
jgi:hypothetical protein